VAVGAVGGGVGAVGGGVIGMGGVEQSGGDALQFPPRTVDRAVREAGEEGREERGRESGGGTPVSPVQERVEGDCLVG
jgi:hypothetical protein